MLLPNQQLHGAPRRLFSDADGETSQLADRSEIGESSAMD
jgi:hypothetical protein